MTLPFLPPIVGFDPCSGSSSAVNEYQLLTTCVAENSGIYFLQTDESVSPPVIVMYDFAGNVVVGLTPIVCPSARIDVESKCYQDITDPTIKYSRNDVWDATQNPTALLGSVWQDANGNVIAPPGNTELCDNSGGTIVPLPVPLPLRAVVNGTTWVAPVNCTSYSFHARQGANGTFTDSAGTVTNIVQGEGGSYDSNQSTDIPFGGLATEISSLAGDIVIEYITI